MAQAGGTNGHNLCPYVLYNIEQVADGNAPGRKIQPSGFLQMLMCCQQSNASILNDAYDGGHTKPTQISYMKRPLTSIVQAEDDCDINAEPTYDEFTAPGTTHRQVAFFLPDSLVYQYCIDVSNMRTIGAPATRVMDEVYKMFVMYANTLLGAIDQVLVTAMATQFGINISTGSSLSYLNINQDGDKMLLNNGMIQIMRDLQENEICEPVCMVGGGLWSGYDMAQIALCCNAAGVDLSRFQLPTFYFDKNTQTIWGPNQVGVFAPGSTKFISRLKYEKEAFSGLKGGSMFTTLQFPVAEFNCNPECLNDLIFDAQFKYIDCPGTYTVNGTPTSLGRGWLVILSKDFILFAEPTDLWDAADPMFGTNGTWKYVIGNSTYTGGTYGAYGGY